MELKKNPKADLEKRRGLYLEIGLVVILGISLIALEIKNYDEETIVVEQRTAVDEIEDVVIQTDVQETPPPPPPEAPEVTTEFEIVDDEAEIQNELHVDAEVKEDTRNVEIVKVEVEEEEEEVEEEIFQVVESAPEFPGGEGEMYKYFAQNIKYPSLARENGITGRVYVTFVVEKDGSIANPRVLRDIGGGCGAEAVRVVKSMPKWNPGKQRGKAVRVQFNLPVSFQLQ
ncbi:MAG: energy transducer TonB [Bacteroidales bacterium]|nr:energy transducer TonB [Bacteroidales bacterium]MBR1799841.1 energy transducer TonB [Bacteroidales bacterium]